MTRHLPILLSALLSLTLVPHAAAQARAEPAPITFSVAGGFNLSRLSFTFDLLDEIPGDLVELETDRASAWSRGAWWTSAWRVACRS